MPENAYTPVYFLTIAALAAFIIELMLTWVRSILKMGGDW